MTGRSFFYNKFCTGQQVYGILILPVRSDFMYTAKESIKRTMILFAVICCVASVISVSYTHLDVYKRQIHCGSKASPSAACYCGGRLESKVRASTVKQSIHKHLCLRRWRSIIYRLSNDKAVSLSEHITAFIRCV